MRRQAVPVCGRVSLGVGVFAAFGPLARRFLPYLGGVTQPARVGRVGRVAARKKPFLSCQREGSFLKPERPLRVPSAHERWRLLSFVPPAYAAVEQARLWTLWADVDFAAITRFLFANNSKAGAKKILSAGRLEGLEGFRERCESARPGLAFGPGCPSASLLLSPAQNEPWHRHGCPNRCDSSPPYAPHRRRGAADPSSTQK